MGHGIFDPYTEWDHGDQQEVLAVFDLIRSGNRCILLCYYRALQMGEASKVVPIDKLSVVITLVLAFVFLHEEFTAKSLIGCILIGVGTLVMVL